MVTNHDFQRSYFDLVNCYYRSLWFVHLIWFVIFPGENWRRAGLYLIIGKPVRGASQHKPGPLSWNLRTHGKRGQQAASCFFGLIRDGWIPLVANLWRFDGVSSKRAWSLLVLWFEIATQKGSGTSEWLWLCGVVSIFCFAAWNLEIKTEMDLATVTILARMVVRVMKILVSVDEHVNMVLDISDSEKKLLLFVKF